jgi:predicted SAM-dependent methyltransferase
VTAIEELTEGRAKAERLVENGSFEQAETVLLSLLAAHPDHPGLLSDLAVVLFQLGRPVDSLELLDRALQVDQGAQEAADNHLQLLQLLDQDADYRPIAIQHNLVCSVTSGPASSGAAAGTSRQLRLNLGAGDDRREGYLNVDLRVETADLVADVRELPFAAGAADELLAQDVLEHFWRDSVPALLGEWQRVLRPGGLLRVRVPNLPVLAALLDTDQHDQVVENIYGGHRWGPEGAYDTHHWGWSRTSLVRELDRAGFDVQLIDNEPNMTALAVKR